jgi:hypothetical protein
LDNSPYEEGFWHLITKLDHQSGDRLLDPRRAERLPWCKPTIEHSAEPAVKMWRYKERRGKTRIYIWLENWDYVTILEERQLRGGRQVAFLITAYYVSGSSTRRTLQKKYDARMQ